MFNNARQSVFDKDFDRMINISDFKKYIADTENDPGKWRLVLSKLIDQFIPHIHEVYLCLHGTEETYKDFAGIGIAVNNAKSTIRRDCDNYIAVTNVLTGTPMGELRFIPGSQALLAGKLTDNNKAGEFYSITFRSGNDVNFESLHQELQETLNLLLPSVLKSIAHHLTGNIPVHKNFLMTDMLDKINAPAMLVNCDGIVLYANRLAKSVIINQENNFCLTPDNTLSVKTKREKRRLPDILVSIFDREDVYDTVVQLSSENAVYADMLIARRLGNSTVETPCHQLFQGAPCALVVVKKGEGVINIPPEMIREGMGFTKRESQLAASLVAGNSLSDYSREAGIKKETTRWHMKQIQQKTGATGQMDLVRRVLYQFTLSSLF